MTALRIEPIQQPETECAEYSLIDEAGEEVAVVTGKVWALKFAVSDELLEVAIQSAKECAECNGTGLVGKHFPGHDTVAEWDADDQPCSECTPTRELIERAGGIAP